MTMMRWTRDDSIAIAIIMLGTCICYGTVLWGGAVALPLNIVAQIAPWSYSYERPGFIGHTLLSDLVTQYYPQRMFLARELLAGRLPLWNPYLFAGTPFLAEANTSVFYPINWLFVILPTAYAFGLVAWLHITITAIASWLLGRFSGVSAYASLLVALVAFGNGFVALWVSIPDIGGVIAWAPVVMIGALWLAHAIGHGNIYRQSQAALLFVGANLMAWLAQPDTSFYVTVISGCTLFVVAWQDQRARMHVVLLWAIGCACLFVALFLPQLLPTLEFSNTVTRSVGGRVSVTGFITPFFPEFYTSWHQLGDWGVHGTDSKAEHYIGLIPLGLFIWGMWFGAGRMIRLWTGIAVLVWMFSFSSPSFWYWIPIVSQFNDLARCLVLGLIGMGVVAAHALDRVIRAIPHERDVWLRRWALLWAMFMLAGILWMRLIQPTFFWQAIHSLHGMGWIIALSSIGALVLVFTVAQRWKKWAMVALFLVAGGDLWWYWAPFQTFQYPQQMYRPTPDLLREIPVQITNDLIMPPTRMQNFLQAQKGIFRIFSADYPFYQANTAMVAQLQDIRGFESLMWGKYAQFVRRWEGKTHNEPIGVSVYITGASATPQWLDITNVRFVLFKPHSPLITKFPGLRLVHQSDEGSIYENLNVLPRAYFVHQVELFDNVEDAYRRLRDPKFPIHTAVTSIDAVPALDAPQIGEMVPTITSYLATEVRINAQPKSRALLVLSDTNYPGWHVSVDGVEQPIIYTVNGVFRGVVLSAGNHDVRFWYWPKSFAIGLWALFGALCVILAAIVYLIVRRRRERSVDIAKL
ncbi:MAG: hypothetical protein EBS29_03315 [Chloroflexia bacterium]|nr:hypothetical protein [Chloroflexia bacterium]